MDLRLDNVFVNSADTPKSAVCVCVCVCVCFVFVSVCVREYAGLLCAVVLF